MISADTPQLWSWSKPKRRARTSVSTILDRKSSAGSSVSAQYKMIYQPTEFHQGCNDFDRWPTCAPAPALKQAKKSSKGICFHHLGAEIVCWIVSPRTIQMIYQPTKFRQGSNDFGRSAPAPILKQAKKMGKDIWFRRLGAEIICRIVSLCTVQSDISTYRIPLRQ